MGPEQQAQQPSQGSLCRNLPCAGHVRPVCCCPATQPGSAAAACWGQSGSRRCCHWSRCSLGHCSGLCSPARLQCWPAHWLSVTARPAEAALQHRPAKGHGAAARAAGAADKCWCPGRHQAPELCCAQQVSQQCCWCAAAPEQELLQFRLAATPAAAGCLEGTI